MNSFDEHVRTWEDLGSEDPLWAVVSHDEKRNGGWNTDEFYASGERDVRHYLGSVQKLAGFPARFDHVLDFGCGVGRLCIPWARHADKVTGMDVSSAMIARAKDACSAHKNIEFVHNPVAGLPNVPDATFDLVFSLMCLQHVEWKYAVEYLREFARVCRPGGFVVFQLPSRIERTSLGPKIREGIMDLLPKAFVRSYRKLRHGSQASFKVYYTPPCEVMDVCVGAGLESVMMRYDKAAGQLTEGFLYVFSKPRGA